MSLGTPNDGNLPLMMEAPCRFQGPMEFLHPGIGADPPRNGVFMVNTVG